MGDDTPLPPPPTGVPIVMDAKPGADTTQSVSKYKKAPQKGPAPGAPAPSRYAAAQQSYAERERTTSTRQSRHSQAASPSARQDKPTEPTRPQKSLKIGPIIGVAILIIVAFVFPYIGELFDTSNSSSSSRFTSSYTAPEIPDVSGITDATDGFNELTESQSISTTLTRIGTPTVGFVAVPGQFILDPNAPADETQLTYIDVGSSIAVTLAVYPNAPAEGLTQLDLAEQVHDAINAEEGGYAALYDDANYTDEIPGTVDEVYGWWGNDTRITQYFFTTSDGLIRSITIAQLDSEDISYHYYDDGTKYSFGIVSLMFSFNRES